MSDAPIAYYDEDGTAIFRASSIGACEAALVHSLRGVEPAPPPEDMLRRFQDGHLHEPAMLDWLRGQGFLIEARQDEVEVVVTDAIRMVGHVDGVGVKDDTSYVIECKSMSESAFKLWKAKGFEAFPKYAQQITVYMHALEMPAAYVVKNKNSGETQYSIITDPPALLAKLKAKTMRVERIARTNRTPECPNPFDYPCPFFGLHEDRKSDPGVPIEELLAPRVDVLAKQYLGYKEESRRFGEMAEKTRDEIIGLMGESDGGMTRRYVVQVEEIEQRRIDTGRLKAAMDVTQFEKVSRYKKLVVKERGTGNED